MAENRFKKYAQPSSSVFYADPAIAAEERRKEEDQEFQRRQLAISQQNANTSAANAAVTAANANKPPAGFERGPDGSLRFTPGGPADPAVIAAAETAKADAKASGKVVGADPDRPAQILTVLDNIAQLRKAANKTLAVGKFSEGVRNIPLVGGFIGQNRADVEGALKMIQGDLIQQQIARLSQLNGGNGVASIANSETEAARMAPAIANLDPHQKPEQFQIELDRAEA